MKRFSVLIATVMAAMIVTANPVIYVAPGGNGEGTSWADPMGNIQQALDSAYASREYTEVWVKAGTYPLETMITLQDSVALYGGFVGTESDKSEREKASALPWDYLHRTVLDGQNRSKQLKTVQVADTVVEIEGIEFANGKGTDNDAPIRLTTGAYLHNCIIRDAFNNVSGGGGVQVYRGAHIDGCLFMNNRQESDANGGGGLFLNTSSEGYTAMIENCEFVGNRSTIRGAAMGVQGYSRVTVRNCRIYDNTAMGTDGELKPGAAIYDNSAYQTIITNNLIYNNTGSNFLYFKGLMCANNTMVKNIGNMYIAAANGSTKVVNNIVWSNWQDPEGTVATGIAGVMAELTASNNGTYLPLPADKGWIRENNIEFSSNNTNWKMAEYETGIGSGPMFDSVPLFYGALPVEMTSSEKEEWRGMLKDMEYNLTTGSPCLNAGQTAELVTMTIETYRDEEGNRIKDTIYTYEYPAEEDYIHMARPQGPAYDMGAVELPYYNIELSYDAAKGTVMDEEANVLASGTVLNGAKGQKLTVYIFSNAEQPFTVKAVYADETEEDITSLVTEDGLLALTLKQTMVLRVDFDNNEAIDNVTWDGVCRIYTIQGWEMQPGDLPAGIYIMTNGKDTRKVLIR